MIIKKCTIEWISSVEHIQFILFLEDELFDFSSPLSGPDPRKLQSVLSRLRSWFSVYKCPRKFTKFYPNFSSLWSRFETLSSIEGVNFDSFDSCQAEFLLRWRFLHVRVDCRCDWKDNFVLIRLNRVSMVLAIVDGFGKLVKSSLSRLFL